MAPHKILPSQAYLQACFQYDPKEGVLFWLHRPPEHFATMRAWGRFEKLFAGKIAGCIHELGDGKLVIDISLHFKRYYAHQIIIKLVYNIDTPMVDHIDGNSLNNSLFNLRPCTQVQNAQNRKTNKNQKTGHKGVSYMPRIKKYVAKIQKNKKREYLGVFDTLEEASAAYQKAADVMHGDFKRR